jgi:hypothetical protein
VWLPLLLVALLSGLSAALPDRRWLEYTLAPSAGTFAGLIVGCEIWPDPDGATRSYYGVIVIAVTLLTIFISFISGLAGIMASNLIGKRRNAIWIALVCSAMYGPIVLVLTPPLAARRIARTELLASERFSGLRTAAERAGDRGSALGRACDEQTLMQNYSGPPFNQNAWQEQQLGENDEYASAREDGYVFGIWCYRSAQAGYVIDARPEREGEDCRRQFCTDDSRKAGCDMEYKGTRNVCKPSPN